MEVLFGIQGTDFTGRAELVRVLEPGEDGLDTIYGAILVEVFSGDAGVWDGGLLESEIIRIESVECNLSNLFGKKVRHARISNGRKGTRNFLGMRKNK